jgi:UDP-N-acetylglucosamine pyrophosphorylase
MGRIMSDFDAFRDKMQGAAVREAAILAFERAYGKLAGQESGMVREQEISPAVEVPTMGAASDEGFDADLLGRTVVVKLNGGLGTSMGLQKAKSLLEVKDGNTFLELMVRQITHLREATGAEVRFLLMNSFATSADTREALARTGLGAEDCELLQNQVPKIDARTMAPVHWDANPELEWCPPGHGDLYPALVGSGWLERLLQQGVRYAFVSNSDNLGAVLDAGLLRYFAESEAPFLMEVTQRTESDKKGGHLARRNADGRLILREVAQCPDEDLGAFQDIRRHRYFNTNNLWIRLDVLAEVMEAEGGVLPLPVIRNRKTVDPRDKKSTAVYQLETAMGAAVECFDGAAAVEVPRARFAPVKTTGDLLALRSDAYLLSEDGCVVLAPERHGVPPVIRLGSDYKLVDSLEELGTPSLLRAVSLDLEGPFSFGPGASVEGEAMLKNGGAERMLLEGVIKGQISV